MNSRRRVYLCAWTIALIVAAAPANAETILVAAGGDLQAALNAARPGDTILLEPGATYAGNFKLPVHGGTAYVTIRSAASDALLPAAGARMTPAYAAYLPRIVSPNNAPALRTAAGASYWRLMLLEIGPTAVPSGTALDLGDGGNAQNALSLVPHHLIVDRVYVHGDPVNGQRRGIGLNSAHTTIVNSHVSDIKSIGQDSQAIAGWNGPGPFRIANNYLEAAGENVMFGGDDPRIDQLIPSDIEFRGNLVSRPMAWRNPVLPAPAQVRVSLDGTGTLGAGTYGYRVLARRQIGGAWIRSAAGGEVTVVAGAGSAVRVQWDAVPGAVEYYVYGRTPGAQNRYWRTTSTLLVDDGQSAGTAGTPPSTGTMWQVKNLFELKNARRVRIEDNTFENNWEQAQAGTAILFTSRNQYGRCLWCRVEDVVFEHNVVRRTGGAIQILGWDDERPSSQTTTITIRHNEFSDFGKSYGGNGYFIYVIDQPANVTVDHNTVISNDGGGVIMADKRAAINFVFTNNVMRHNNYGIFGSGYSAGLATIARYFPGSHIERNVLAGGSAAKYPGGNLFPTVAAFQSHFVDYAGGNYALVPGTDWAQAGTDGEDLGADISALHASNDDPTGEPLSIVTASLPPATEGQPYAAAAAAAGGVPGYSWEAVAGALPSGLWLDATSGQVTGVPASSGDFTVTLRVTDSWGAAVSQPATLRVERAVEPVTIVTPGLYSGIATRPYSQALEASGGLGTYLWSLAGGSLPAGLALSADGVLSGTPQQPANWPVTFTAVDAADGQRRASRTLLLMIGPPPNLAPSVRLRAPTATSAVPVGATTTLAAAANDPDGYVTRVDFHVNGEAVGSGIAPDFALPWLVPASGTYSIKAVAVDNAGAAVESPVIAMTTQSEIVLYAADVTRMSGNYQLKADAAAAGGYALWNQNHAAGKVNVAAAAPGSYAEFTFVAEAGRPYQLWLRGRAEWNDPANDSVHVQFDGVAGARIGSSQSLFVNLEDAALAGIGGWGWQDTGYGAGVLGTPIVFERTGLQTIRLQPREDGLLIDQVILSPARFLGTAPGTLTGDATIVGK